MASHGSVDMEIILIVSILVLSAAALLVLILPLVRSLERSRQALQAARAELEQRIVARTADLTQAVAAQRAMADALRAGEEEITERQRAEIALRQSEEQLRATFDALGDYVHVVDADLRITLFNRAFEKMNTELGLATNALGQTPMDLFPFLPASVGDEYQHVLATGEMLFTHEATQVGSMMIYTETRKIPIVESGRVARIVTVVRDVTERKQAEEALRRHDAILEAATFAAEQFLRAGNWEQNIRLVLERLGQGVGADRAHIFENHTAGGASLTSLRYEWTASGITPLKDNAALQETPWQASGFGRWEETLSQNRPIYGLVRDFPSGEKRTLMSQGILSLVTMPIFAGQSWWGFIGFDACLDEREWQEAEIEALKVAASTFGAAIERQRTEQALKASEERFHAVSGLASPDSVLLALEKERSAILASFIQDITHEFANPLSVIKSDLYLVPYTTEPEKRQQRLEKLSRQVFHIERLVEGLLTMSRLDGGSELAFEPVDLNKLLRLVLDCRQASAENKFHTITMDLEAGLPPVLADRRYLHMALTKLVENAILYTPPGGTIRLHTAWRGDQAVVEVSDTGIGIQADNLERIFLRFYRVDEAREERGAGLGLPIARKIIERHQGTIEVASTPGQGSTFRVFLPIRSN